MVVFDYKCEICNYIIEDVKPNKDGKFPKRKNCPKCKTEKSCHRIWGNNVNIHIPNDFLAVPRCKGAAEYQQKMKKYNGLKTNGEKRFY